MKGHRGSPAPNENDDRGHPNRTDVGFAKVIAVGQVHKRELCFEAWRGKQIATESFNESVESKECLRTRVVGHQQIPRAKLKTIVKPQVVVKHDRQDTDAKRHEQW